ncbi:MAG: HEPN domain-containing protein [Armatimonadota bacterium]|nr:HEPN domain-containing protein [Armatimonadota bacterium]
MHSWSITRLSICRTLGRRVASGYGEACGRLLDRFYIPARYPSSWDRGSPKDYFTREDAGHALRCAESILRFCEGLLAQQR